MSIKSVMPSSYLILCRPLLLLPPIPPSIRVFSSESTLRMRWPKYWSFSFSISPCNEHPDWSPLLIEYPKTKTLTIPKNWQDCRTTETLIHWWWKFKMIVTLKDSWQFLMKLNAILPSDSVIVLWYLHKRVENHQADQYSHCRRSQKEKSKKGRKLIQRHNGWSIP